jgi:hypothetical protein
MTLSLQVLQEVDGLVPRKDPSDRALDLHWCKMWSFFGSGRSCLLSVLICMALEHRESR